MSVFKPTPDLQQKLKSRKKFDNNVKKAVNPHNVSNNTAVKLKLAQEIASIGFLECNLKTGEINFSEETYKMWNSDIGDLKSSEISFEALLARFAQSDFHEIVRNAFNNTISSGTLETVELKIVNADGKERWLRMKGYVVEDQISSNSKLIASLHDITEWKKFEIEQNEKLNFINALINTIPNPIFYKDSNGIYRHCNDSFAEYLGVNRKDIINHSVYDISPKEYAEIYYKADCELMKSKGIQIYESKVRLCDGSDGHVIFNKAALVNGDGQVTGLVGTINDMTEHIKIENTVKNLLNLKGAILDINNSIMDICDINDFYRLILKKVFYAMEKSDLASLMILDDTGYLRIVACIGYDIEKASEFKLKLEDSFAWRRTEGDLKCTVIINDVQKLALEVSTKILDNVENFEVASSISAPIIIKGKLFGLMNIDSKQDNVYNENDWAMLEYARNQIAIAVNNHLHYENTIFLSRYDKLTNIFNRRYFEEVFEIILSKAERYNASFLFVMFDLNGLKTVNDSYGHLAGDEMIKYFVSHLNRITMSSDILARIGGDEFAAVFFDMEKKILIKKLGELLEYFYSHPLDYEGNSIVCSFSFGIASFPEAGNAYDNLLKAADENMYIHKKQLKSSQIKSHSN